MLGRLQAAGLARRHSLYMVASQLSMTLLQGLQFLVLARVLGPEQFGRVASVIAFTSPLLPFSGLGLSNVALKRLARGEGAPQLYLGNALAVTSLTGLAFVLVAAAAGSSFLSEPQVWLLLIVFGLSELIVTKYIDVAAHIFFGLEQHGRAVLFYNLQQALRLAFAVSLAFLFIQPTAWDWAWLHLASGSLALVAVATMTLRRIGRPTVNWAQAWRDTREGGWFSMIFSARSVYTDADKAILARMAALDVAGAYTAAYRLVYMAYAPVMAVLVGMQARMFRAGGESGMTGVLHVLKRLGIVCLGYGMVVALVLYVGAPLVPLVLGEKYATSSVILAALCLLPLVLMVQSVCSEALASADRQRIAGTLHLLGAMLALGLNLLLVPRYSWAGAVAAAYLTQVLLSGALLAAVWVTFSVHPSTGN